MPEGICSFRQPRFPGSAQRGASPRLAETKARPPVRKNESASILGTAHYVQIELLLSHGRKELFRRLGCGHGFCPRLAESDPSVANRLHHLLVRARGPRWQTEPL